ncbi:MAG TPA: hypothetical protein VMB72_10840 [Acidimicrobiales bacterium]|nr:hypothetical protein [Acidimicrobiales bacterium]
MRHSSEGMIRRLEDEPFAVPDAQRAHVAGCPRCRRRRQAVRADLLGVRHRLSVPQLVPDTDVAWRHLVGRIQRQAGSGDLPAVSPPWRPRLRPWRRRVSLRVGVALGLVGALVAGTAAATTLTSVFAPTKVAPLSFTSNDVQELEAVLGPAGGGSGDLFSTPSGSRSFGFGTLSWSSAVAPSEVSSPAAAARAAGIPLALPTQLPAGVGPPGRSVVEPELTATLVLGPAAGTLAGGTVVVHTGPGMVVAYGGLGTGVPTMAVAAMVRPTATSSGATLAQIEAYVLSRRGVPPALAEELRLLGGLGTTLPVPTPPGSSARSVQVRGWPGVAVALDSGVAGGVVWEDGAGMLHGVVGILDQGSLLGVARQIG